MQLYTQPTHHSLSQASVVSVSPYVFVPYDVWLPPHIGMALRAAGGTSLEQAVRDLANTSSIAVAEGNPRALTLQHCDFITSP